MNLLKTITVVSLVVCSLLSGLASAARVNIENPRIWPAPDHTRLVLDISGEVKHKAFSLANPNRLVLDIQDSRIKDSLKKLKLSGTPVKKIRTATRNGDDVRIVLDLNRKVTVRSFVLKPNDQYGRRLVVDLMELESRSKPVVKKSAEVRQSNRDVVIVVDAGHGGDDPGAIGPGRIKEKNVVLAIAKELKKSLDATRGYKVVLTRTGDYYIGLRNRTKIARKQNADLLISVHADAFKLPQANGASVFALSKRGASSETARWLAASENRADLIGGVGGVSLGDKDDVLAGVLLDLSMTASMKASLGVGDHVLQSIGKVGRLHKKRVEQAGFVVLKSPDIPSILVETGFISNPSEARKLNSKRYQRSIAKAIKTGLTKHFSETPPDGSWLAWNKNKRTLAQAPYTIRRGDTLSGIARKNGVSVSKIRKLNGLTTDTLRVGQKISIPTS